MQHTQNGPNTPAFQMTRREKSIGVTEARQKFAEVIDGVQHNGDTIILLKNGTPAAVLVSIGMFEQWKRKRNALFDVFARVQAQNADIDMSEDELMAFVNEETGGPLVENVLLSREIYQGKHLDRLPDLIVEWNRKAPISAVSSPKTGRMVRRYTGNRTGDHTNEGAFFATGARIPQCIVGNAVSMMDIAPTVTRMLGIPWSGWDGKPIDAIIG